MNATTYFVYVGTFLERECRTLRGAKLCARALTAKGFDVSILVCEQLSAGSSRCQRLGGEY